MQSRAEIARVKEQALFSSSMVTRVFHSYMGVLKHTFLVTPIGQCRLFFAPTKSILEWRKVCTKFGQNSLT